MPQALCHLHVPRKNTLHAGATETRGYAKERHKIDGKLGENGRVHAEL
jgi:hypothetical protein